MFKKKKKKKKGESTIYKSHSNSELPRKSYFLISSSTAVMPSLCGTRTLCVALPKSHKTQFPWSFKRRFSTCKCTHLLGKFVKRSNYCKFQQSRDKGRRGRTFNEVLNSINIGTGVFQAFHFFNNILSTFCIPILNRCQ